MKKNRGEAAPTRPKGRAGIWVAYGIAALLFAVGQMALNTSLPKGIALIAAGTLLGLAAYVLPALPWAQWAAAWRAMRQPAPAIPVATGKAKGGKAPAPLAAVPRPSIKQLLTAMVEGLATRLFPEDRLEIGRFWLLLPAGLLILLSLLGLNSGSVTKAVGFFVTAIMLGAVYLQAMERPIALAHMRQNLRSLASLSLGVPGNVIGAYLMHARFERPGMVWFAFLLCAASSAWMIYSLKLRPLDLGTGEDEGPVSLGWSPPAPFYSSSRLALISTLLAGAVVSAYLARVVFPAEHAGWSVGLGFLAIALLIGSFPWMPSGLAWNSRLADPLKGVVALAGALGAFMIGSFGQGLIDRGNVDGGLWAFLAGGTLLVLALGRFDDPSTQDAEIAGKKHELEIGALLLLMVAAFSFRIWKIGVFPYGVEGDEGGGGVWAMDVMMGRVEHPLIHQNYPLAFFSVTAFFFKVAGVSLASLRWHSVFFGTLSVATTYFFMRLLMGRWAAFLATALMSFSYWHLHYSRFGHYNIEQVAMQMMAFYFVFKAMRTGKLWQWVVGGVAFGLGMFPHMASRLLPFQGIALVLFFFMGRRELLRKYLPGFLAFVIASWAIASPAVVYWQRATSISMGRIQSVSIFDKNNTNAPVDTLGGFVRNCKVSMLMFNYEGDTRSRDNPLAPEKILEHWTAVLFALGFVYCLYHWRDPMVFFALAVFLINLSASVFSVEAPQTLRTAGNIPIVFVMIALPLAQLRAALLRMGRYRGALIFALLCVPAFGYFSYTSARKYFVDARRLQFDTHATYVAEKAGHEGGPDTQAVFWGTGFAASHPPMVLLAQSTPLRNFYGPFEYLPITKATEKDHLLFLVDDYQQMLPYVQSIYPKSKVEPLPDLVQGGNLAQYIRVNKDEIRATQGLSGQAVVAGKSVAVSGVEPQFPSKGLENATRLDLKGSVSVDRFGSYGFEVTGQGSASVVVNGKTVFNRRGGPPQKQEIMLAKGLHAFALRLDPAGPKDVMTVKLTANQPHSQLGNWVQRGRGEQTLGLADTLQLPATGFYAEYFAARLPEGEPLIEVIEPVVLNQWLDSPITGNWTARWRTRFRVEQGGDYRFNERGGSVFAQVKVDGKLVWRQGSDPRGEMHPPQILPSIKLNPGWHDYEAIFTTTGPPGDQLRWTPPGQPEQLFWLKDMKPLSHRLPL